MWGSHWPIALATQLVRCGQDAAWPERGRNAQRCNSGEGALQRYFVGGRRPAKGDFVVPSATNARTDGAPSAQPCRSRRRRLPPGVGGIAARCPVALGPFLLELDLEQDGDLAGAAAWKRSAAWGPSSGCNCCRRSAAVDPVTRGGRGCRCRCGRGW